MNEKVKWKLAFKNLEKQTKMNMLIFLQLAILLLICMSCVSMFSATTQERDPDRGSALHSLRAMSGAVRGRPA